MQDLPVMLTGYTLMLSEPVGPKMGQDDDGVFRQSTSREGIALFQAVMFAKPKHIDGQPRQPKGEEIRVTLAADPGGTFEAGDYVELVSPTVSHYLIEGKGRTTAGLVFKALGLTPVTRTAKTAKTGGSGTTAKGDAPAGP